MVGPGIVAMHHPSTGQEAYAPAGSRMSLFVVGDGNCAPGDHEMPFQPAVVVLVKPTQNFADEQATPLSRMP